MIFPKTLQNRLQLIFLIYNSEYTPMSAVIGNFTYSIPLLRKKAITLKSGIYCRIGKFKLFGETDKDKDIEGSEKYLRMAALLDHVEAQSTLAILLLEKANKTKQTQTFDEAVHWLRMSANQGNARSQYHLASLLLEKDSTPIDEKESSEWRRIKQDNKEAAEWYQKAAMQTLSHKNASDLWILESQCALGKLYECGKGVPKDEKIAANLYKQAAVGGLVQAQIHLGFLYAHGLGVEKNHKKAEEWYRCAVKQNNIEAKWNLGYFLFVVKQERKNLINSEAATLILAAAKECHPEALYFLVTFYQNLLSPEAKCWIIKCVENAAMKGHPKAQVLYGNMRKAGFHCIPDIEEAVEWYQKAAEQGNIEAQYQLGYTLISDKSGLIKNDTLQGILLLRVAKIKISRKTDSEDLLEFRKNKNHIVYSRYLLGYMFLNAQGVSKDEKKAAKWYKKAAIKGHVESQLRFGIMRFNGDGIPKDEKEGFKWLQKAAQKGNVYAQVLVGRFLCNGWGTQKDEIEGVEWLQRALEQQDIDEAVYHETRAKAKLHLGICYYKNIGVAKDLKRAGLLLQDAAKTIPLVESSLRKEGIDPIAPFNELSNPTLENAVSVYQNALEETKKDAEKFVLLKTLGFCYQIGLGTKQDVVKAVEKFEEAAEFAECDWDLYACYTNLYRENQHLYSDVVSQDLTDPLGQLENFYQSLKQKPSNLSKERMLFMAYLNEKSAPGLSRNLKRAVELYQKATSTETDYAAVKVKYYTPLLTMSNRGSAVAGEQIDTLQHIIASSCPGTSLQYPVISQLVADYAFEPPIEAEKPKL